MYNYILIDGNSLFFKAFYATFVHLKNNKNGFRNTKGVPINAVRTFGNMILNLYEEHPTSKFLIAFDEKDTDTYRTKHDFYKANRIKQPDDLYTQIPLVKKFLELYGFKWIASKNFEADDIIGIMSKRLKNKGKVKIITTDKDLLQLVDQNVDVFLAISGISTMKEFNIDNFKELFNNLMPNQVPDLKGIMGDSSDNLKGIKGLGEKNAIKLLNSFSSLEKIYDSISEITSESVKNSLLEGRQMGFLSKELATIMTEGEIDLIENDLIVFEKNEEELRSFLMDMEVFSLLNRVFN